MMPSLGESQPAQRLFPLILALLIASGAGCHSGPRATTYPGAIAGTCMPTSDSDPFIVDWSPDKRGDLELALQKSVVAVKLSCDRLDILADCQVPGEYLYAGLTEREQVITLESMEDVRANLPLRRGSPSQLEAELERGATLDIALAIVGKKTSSTRRVLRSDLQGECAGATHFIRSATLGAFAMKIGSRGKATVASDLFDPGVPPPYSSSSTPASRDGSLETCRRVSPGAGTELPGCASPLRLELKAIVEGPIVRPAPAADESGAPPACPAESLANDLGKCVPMASAEPHICSFQDSDDCARQCERGSMGSCALLGRNYQIGRGVPRDVNKGVTILARACNGGAAPACGRIGELMLSMSGKEQEGLRLLQKSCSAGWAEGCTMSATRAIKDKSAKVDVVALFRRGCAGGDPEGCWSLGSLFQAGLGVPQNDWEAQHYFKLGCQGGARLGCSSFAQTVDRGRPDDAVRSVQILRNACDHGYSSSCSDLAASYFLGKGVAKDNAAGIGLLERACEGNDTSNCLTLGMRYAGGVGVKADAVRAVHYLNRACETGLVPACVQAQKLANMAEPSPSH